jgi:beta-lactamase regulating signal transducer with metallopeptidase domain
MLAALIEAALRSLVLALAVWTGLRIFRIQNVIAQRCAWTAVLIGSLLMPVVLPFTTYWHGLSFTTIPGPASLGRLQSALAHPSSTPWLRAARSSEFAPVRHNPVSTPGAVARKSDFTSTRAGSLPGDLATATNAISPKSDRRAQVSIVTYAVLAYLLIAFMLLVRLLCGLANALRLWGCSIPISRGSAAQFGAGLNLRSSRKVSTPVTIGSGIVLPAGYTNWTDEKLRIVLAHERSHVDHHDFHFQILASLYAAVAWFSPLGWWLKNKLSDLGEAISDRSGLKAASSRSAYAQVLLEFAAAPRPSLIGVAMARPSSISRRIERLLNDSYLRHAFAGGVGARIAVVVVPVILFAATALIRVQAATEPASGVPFRAPSMVNSHPLAVAANSPAALVVLSPPAPSEMAYAAPSAPLSPAAQVENAGAQSEATFDRNLTFSGKLDLTVATGSGHIHFTRGSANQIHIHGVVKSHQPGNEAEVQQLGENPPIEQNGNVIRIGRRQEGEHNVSIDYEIEAPADSALNAASGSGDIVDQGVGENAKLITGSGNISAVGIEGGFKVQTGSGNIAIDGSGQGDAKAQTGSGNIDLKGVQGALEAQTGSGDIKAAGTPSSPWKLQAGSGQIELSIDNAPMNLDASTGSGTISTDHPMTMQTASEHNHLRASVNGGGPEVRIQTGSGDIRIH